MDSNQLKRSKSGDSLGKTGLVANNKAAGISQKILGVWALNIIPYGGLGLLLAAGWRALPVLFFLWVAEAAFIHSVNPMVVYFVLSIIGTFVAVVRGIVETADQDGGDSPFTTLESLNSGKQSPNFNIDAAEAVRLNAIKENGQYRFAANALPSFEEKVQRAELQLKEQSANDDDNAEDNSSNKQAPVLERYQELVDQNQPTDVESDEQRDAEDRRLESRRHRKEVDADDERVFGHNPLSDSNQVSAANDAVSPQQLVFNALNSVISNVSNVPNPVNTNAASSQGSASNSVGSGVSAAANSSGDGSTVFLANYAPSNTSVPKIPSGASVIPAAFSNADDANNPAPPSEVSPPVNFSLPPLDTAIPFSNSSVIAGLGELPTAANVQSIDGYGSSSSTVNSHYNFGGIDMDLGNINAHGSPTNSSAFSSPSQDPAPQSAGAPKDEKRCPKCGADLQGQFSFCLSCLSPLN